MNIIKAVVATLVLLVAVAGCASPAEHFRLEEYGQGWTLEVIEEESGEGLRAKWKSGANRSSKFVNMDDRGGGYVVSMLYLEIEESGNVKNGLMKRFTMKEFSKKTYEEEQGAQWFRVIEGQVKINNELEGELHVRVEGNYEFKGEVTPDGDISIKDRK